MKHVVMFSGGVSSWAAARRVADRHGTADLTLLFSDTKIEDVDLYRFIHEAAANIGVPLTVIADGRTPWEVFRDVRMIGNSRIDPCSRVLKRELLDRWRNANCDPSDTTVYLGISWDEVQRLDRVRSRVGPWTYEAPMCEKPYLEKRDMLRLALSQGLRPPRLYDLGFPHNNCGGFCVKAGQAQFKLLLKTMPERYAAHEAEEEKMRTMLGANVSVMRDRTGGESRPLTMREFRERIEAKGEVDLFDWGGCGCAVDDGVDDARPE